MGSRSSNANTQQVSNVDRRQALQDSLGVSGDNSSITNTTTTNTDFSDRSTTNADFSNRSTNNIDYSNRSTNTTNISSTDHGAIKLATDQVLASLTNNSNTVKTMTGFAEAAAKNSGDLSLKVINSSFDALNQKDHITADLVKNYAALQGTTTSAISSAWQNAKEFEAGKSLGDVKWVIYGLIGVFGLMALGRK